MPRPKLIDVSTAQALARKYTIEISRPTIIKYVQKKKLGHQIGGKGGKWVINEEKWRRFLRGENNDTDQTETDAQPDHEESGPADSEPQEEDTGGEVKPDTDTRISTTSADTILSL